MPDTGGLDVNWDTPAGRLLRRFADSVQSEQPVRVTLFGSAPLQMMVEPGLLSADVDVFSNDDSLVEQVRAAGLGEGQAELYIQVSSELNFRSSPRWRERAREVRLGNVQLIIPHPVDVLIGKLMRLEEKDLEAFRIVLSKTGHPTEAELIEELQAAVDLFRPGFEEETAADLAGNCRRLWPEIYGREVDPRREIIAPALKKRREGYGEPPNDLKQELKDAARNAEK